MYRSKTNCCNDFWFNKMTSLLERKWTSVLNQPIHHVLNVVFIAVHGAVVMWRILKLVVMYLLSHQIKIPTLRNTSAETMQADGRKLTKTPLHLIIIIGEKEYNCDSIVDMLVWSFFIGIRYVTISSKSIKLRNQCQMRFEERCLKLSSTIITSKTKFHSDYMFATGNQDFNVVFTALKNSKAEFMNVCKEICTSKTRSSVIKLDSIDHLVKENTGNILEPDLGLCFGPYYSYYSCQPWNIRLTEFFHLPTHQKIKYCNFLASLHRFAACKQRVGV
uniref:dehydrodolichyl diphosphate synthase complex subunit nus1 n=1 Tax=Ciona intestinalis TaxID=7719 RepID=UPI000EF49346|nr:dehydrodolichyl diphosphate synthase complex subunit nus1 [Ciona intestinalis]|eukprot:XP_026689597.1 dehydrodolichyl diphosphate synthase complex subunit nus1 [Ciona intestinalis]